MLYEHDAGKNNGYTVVPQFVNATLVQITPISPWLMANITIVNEGYKPTYSWGAPSCIDKLARENEAMADCFGVVEL